MASAAQAASSGVVFHEATLIRMAVVEYDPTSLNGCCLTPRLQGDGDLTHPAMNGEGEIA
ncbi:hypothetical protein [Isoptericola rhizosphaerae]|uniref:hypothetical protein n=1 Tax=Isoptericola rhizosphaerae TaxID=3377837 RepID=UPI00383A3BCD